MYQIKKENMMENLLRKISEFLQGQPEIENIERVDEEMGCMCYITLADGKKLLLSIMDTDI